MARRMQEGSRTWEREANRLARSAMPIVSCYTCGHPRYEGYTCPMDDTHAASLDEVETKPKKAKR